MGRWVRRSAAMPLRGRKIGLRYGSIGSVRWGIPRMQLSHAFRCGQRCSTSRIWCRKCRLVPAVGLAVRRAGRARGSSSDGPLPVVPGREAGRKVSALVVGMVAGAGSIAEMGVLRHSAMGLFTGVRSPGCGRRGAVAVDVAHFPARLPVRAPPTAGRGPVLTGLARTRSADPHLRGGHSRRHGRLDPVHLWVRQAGHRVLGPPG